ncbi:MAG: hypothetical protein SGPRY_013269 [Prymnesium sp.]
MVHSTQLDAQLLRRLRAKSPLDLYKVGSSVWVKISSVEGSSKKAKLQGSIKYVDQQSGKDLDPSSEKLLLDLTTRGMRSDLENRWNPEGEAYGTMSAEEVKKVDESTADRAFFVPAACFVGARADYVYKTGAQGLGYYCEAKSKGPAALLVEQVLEHLETGSGKLKKAHKQKKNKEKKGKRDKEKKKGKKEKKEKKKALHCEKEQSDLPEGSCMRREKVGSGLLKRERSTSRDHESKSDNSSSSSESEYRR